MWLQVEPVEGNICHRKPMSRSWRVPRPPTSGKITGETCLPFSAAVAAAPKPHRRLGHLLGLHQAELPRGTFKNKNNQEFDL